MTPGNPLRRHPFLWLTGLLLVAVALWIGYFLATFDLNHYREQVASELGIRLQMPVRLGEAQLELREAGIAFSFNELQIGTAQTPAELHARKVWLQLAWHGLLLKKPILTEVTLSAPRLRISPAAAAAQDEPAPASFNLDVLRDLKINRLEFQHGTLDLTWLDSAGKSRTLAMGDLALEAADLGLGRTVVFNAVGTLLRHSDQARLAITGSVDLPAAGTLRDATWNLALEAKTLEAAQLAGLLPERTGISAEGQLDLTIHLKGALAGTVTAQAEVSGRQLRLRPGDAYQQTLPVKHLQLAGTWQQVDGEHQFRQLAVQCDDLSLAGDVAIRATPGGYELGGQLGNCTLPADTLRRWLPDAVQAGQPLLGSMRPGGLVTIRQAAFRATLPTDGAERRASLTLDGAEGQVQKLVWPLGATRTAELSLLEFRQKAGRWHFERGSAEIAGLPVTFAGTVTPQGAAPAQVNIELGSSTQVGQLTALWPEPLPPGLALAGTLSLQGKLTGTTEQLLTEARLDLAQLDLRYGEHFHLVPTPDATLTLHGQVTRSNLVIDQAKLELPPLKGKLTGRIDWAADPAVTLATRVDIPELTAAYPLAPVVGKLQLQGGVALAIAASGPLTGLKPEIALDLMDVGIPMHGIVADITQLNGRLRFEGQGLRSEQLTARLGESPVNLEARVADLSSPRLELGVRAAAIRADELIFRSDRLMLRDLSGQLVFDRDGIAFTPVNVHLDGGTKATISGSVKNFDNPRVDLDITGSYAKVDEIIGLWTDESPAAEAARKARYATVPHPPLPPILIRVEALEGDLYGMKFSKAKTLIVPTRHSLLLHPLDFNVGEGYCSTQVLVDYTEALPLLRVSGHVENVDAYQIYNELLDRKSILRGVLRGDFYLQGSLGSLGGGKFLPSSFGNVNAEVRNGVLRHSPILSTLFSLLNVSQLFRFQLPDVNSEGVPFSLLTTELAIDKGVINAKQIVIDSEAMSMSFVGSLDMVRDRLDMLAVIKPLGTIDAVVTHLPVAGWILGGEEKALITAQFRVTGPTAKPNVKAIPISAISRGVLGIFRRTLSLPFKVIDDPAILWGGGGKKQ